MRRLTLLLAVVLLMNASCDFIKNWDKPHLELSGGGPYTLNITKFTWTYGVVGFSTFGGDFDRLDEKVYDLLKGKSGICQVTIENVSKNNYGNESSTSVYIGDINVDELNKYSDFSYWQKDAGIRTLLYKKYFKTDIPAIEPPAPTIMNRLNQMDTTISSFDTTLRVDYPDTLFTR